MNKQLRIIAFTSMLTLPTIVSSHDYKIDTDGAHASINFKISHLGFSFIQGRFNQFSGEFTFDSSNIQASSVQVSIDTSSIDSNHSERDKHIRGTDFIDTATFPTSRFVSNKVIKNSDGSLTITGYLTLHGVTQEVSLATQFIGEGEDPWGGYRAGFEAQTRLELKDFGITVMGKSSYVDLDLKVEGIKQLHLR